MKTTVSSASLLACLLLLPGRSLAQFDAYFLPVERGTVESRVELQLHVSHQRYEGFPVGAHVDFVVLSLLGQVAIADTLELGLNVPFLTHVGSDGDARLGGLLPTGPGTSFGNLALSVKVKVLQRAELLALALFSELYLPTHSGDAPHDFVLFSPGAAISGVAGRFSYGGALKSTFLFSAPGQGGGGGYLGTDLFAGVTFWEALTLQLALQLAIPLAQDLDRTALALIPGLELELLERILIGIGARIAVSEGARQLYAGQITLLCHAGARF